MSTINAGNITKGSFIIYKNVPHYVTKTDFMSPGKGSPIMRVKMKNAATGAACEFTYKSNEQVEVADMTKRDMNFLYSDASEAMFIDPRTYDQASVPLTLIEGKVGYLIPNQKCIVLWHGEKAIGVPVILETGIEIQAPIFIKTGDKISVDTTTGQYLARINQ
ncbi:MAG: Elongation factor P [Candidatus Woesebacteria bacterium GW2011_GWB1_38_5]|uniref:Elongation factor P n=1 Tax=Candidatus Woesebacteria bacterium GW2011_GWB1_38_5 TaxID=1618568 RepID=A0A0G0MMU1_9BACT|nr:MAG: Elongation factor P [Candidatus Woesebacteria bacterium GW2011_GWB1_38_5]